MESAKEAYRLLLLNPKQAEATGFSAEDVYDLTKDFSTDPGFYWPKIHIQEEFHSSQCWALAQERELLAVAFVSEMAEVIEVIMIASSLKYRRQGFAKVLLNQIFSKFPEKEVWLEVHRDNQPALHFYESLGFKKVGCRPAYYRDGADAILMSKAPLVSNTKGS